MMSGRNPRCILTDAVADSVSGPKLVFIILTAVLFTVPPGTEAVFWATTGSVRNRKRARRRVIYLIMAM
jgi:hypothetical protein